MALMASMAETWTGSSRRFQCAAFSLNEFHSKVECKSAQSLLLSVPASAQ